MRLTSRLLGFVVLLFPVAVWGGVQVPAPPVAAPVLGDAGMAMLGAVLVSLGAAGIVRRRRR